MTKHLSKSAAEHNQNYPIARTDPFVLDGVLTCYGSVISTTILFSITTLPRFTVNLFVLLRVGSAISNVTTVPRSTP